MISINKRRVSIIGTVGIPCKFGGFEMLADMITKKLSDKYDITVFCSKKYYKNRQKDYHSAKRIFLPIRANGFQSIPYDIISIIISLFISDTLLILGISGCIILPIIKPFHNKKIIVSIDGLEWKRKKWSYFTKSFLKLSQICAIKFAGVVLTDNFYMQEFVRTNYNKKSELIEYGGDHSKYLKPTPKDLIKYPFLQEKYALSIARIESENNCELVLETFSKSTSRKLIYIGNWDWHKYGRRLKEKYSNYNNIILLDSTYDINIINLIRSNCTVYIHGHSVGGTNPSLVEAMSVGVPVLAYDVNFNRKTLEGKGLYFNSVQQLNHQLNALYTDIVLRKKIHQEIKQVALNNYSWDSIIKKYEGIL